MGSVNLGCGSSPSCVKKQRVGLKVYFSLQDRRLSGVRRSARTAKILTGQNSQRELVLELKELAVPRVRKNH